MIEYILNPQVIEALGWTLLHSLWQGAVFAFLLVLILIALRSYTAQSRYVVSVGLLCAFFFCVSATFYHQYQEANTRLTISAQQLNNQSLSSDFMFNTADKNSAQECESTTSVALNTMTKAAEDSTLLASLHDYYDRHLPLLVTLWLLGLLFLQLRFLGQLAYVQRLKHYGSQVFPKSWADKIEELEGKLRIQKKVKYLTSIRIESPMVIGWLKPAILLPQQLFESLSDTEIYAVLAHELAHIRREDFMINLLQTFLCNVFFFHPGVWWMSQRVDDEREHCCDDLAVAAIGGVTSYAKTLINVSELQLSMQGKTNLAMAFSGKKKSRSRGGFTGRIHRLFTASQGTGSFREGFATAMILMIALSLGVVATGRTLSTSDPRPSLVKHKTELADPLKQIDTITNNTISTTTISSSENPTQPVCEPKPSDDLPVSALAKAVVPVLPVAAIKVEELAINSRIDTHFEEGFEEEEAYQKKAANENVVNQIPEMHQATFDGLIEKVKRMVEQGEDVNSRDEYGRTPLHIAAAKNYNIDMQVLFDLGADLDARDNQGRTPMIYAAAAGKAGAVTLLVSRFANHNLADENGLRAYEWAQRSGKIELTKFLELITNNDPTLKANNNQENASFKSLQKEQEKIQEQIQEKVQREVQKSIQKAMQKRETFHIRDGGTSLRQYDMEEKNTDMLEAARNGSIEDCAKLLRNGVSANASDNTGQSALMIAVRRNNLELAKFLIQNGADVNSSSSSGLTALHYAALEDYGQMAQLLLDYDAKVDASMRYSSTDGNYSNEPLVWEYIGATPLLIAVEASNAEVLPILIKAGASKNQVLSRIEYRLSDDRESYLTASEVMGLDNDFLKGVEIKITDHNWSPYRQAELINDPAILVFFPGIKN